MLTQIYAEWFYELILYFVLALKFSKKTLKSSYSDIYFFFWFLFFYFIYQTQFPLSLPPLSTPQKDQDLPWE